MYSIMLGFINKIINKIGMVFEIIEFIDRWKR